MVKKRTIYQKQIEKNPMETAGDLDKLQFSYNAHINKMIAETCEGKRGNEFKKCFKEHSDIIGEIYSIEDYFSDNYNQSRNNEASLDISLKILKNILR